MMLLKANADSEASVPPSRELITEMGRYNEALIGAGVLLDAAGLQSSAAGTRIDFLGDQRQVTDGPFGEPGELIAGFWMIQVKSRDEAIEWARRCPNPHGSGAAQIELRPVFEPGDFTNAPAELVARELELRAAAGRK
jgi:hypothetical protein